jgi:hypothetical protein
VAYRGYTFTVPRTWRVIRLAAHPRSCVRFDRHVLYLGTPGRNQDCPSTLIGTTEALLVQPAAAHAAAAAAMYPVDRLITVTAARIKVTATYSTHRALVDRILELRGNSLRGQPGGQRGPGRGEPGPAAGLWPGDTAVLRHGGLFRHAERPGAALPDFVDQGTAHPRIFIRRVQQLAVRYPGPGQQLHKYGRHHAGRDLRRPVEWGANTLDPILSSTQWAGHHRVHQYQGGQNVTYGGATVNIDQDYLDVQQEVTGRTITCGTPSTGGERAGAGRRTWAGGWRRPRPPRCPAGAR